MNGTVDLWVRTGCNGAREARYLFESVELFWPRGVGKVVVVLDVKDAAIVGHIVPTQTAHAYDVRYEHVPCMPARVFNQVSYLMADRYSTADVIVTIDSDCVLHSPVTPRLLFRDGRVRLPHYDRVPGGHVERAWWSVSRGRARSSTTPWCRNRSRSTGARLPPTAPGTSSAHGACYLDDVARMLSEQPPSTCSGFAGCASWARLSTRPA